MYLIRLFSILPNRSLSLNSAGVKGLVKLFVKGVV